ncbi:hypothetical protein [Halorubrum sp. CGM5_25_10-8B]|uniref:hypothetical protein n=1 Tax=Halorubrum sp. CGM5_25_10-8B TaxID=2518115 RepID=UPI0018EEA090|nr:hypothetical protein [Halorubrum sp. CGM5_25_10-8B]
MSDADASSRAARFVDIGRRLRSSLGDLLSQEFSYSSGHLTAILHGCLFAPSILTFWFVNGVLDFSTAAAVGAVATTAGLQIRLFAYVLLVPVFLLTRLTVHLAHPVHRAQVLSGSCPTTDLMSLDWVSLGILATGLPLAIQNFGPWVGMNVVLLVGILLPQIEGHYCDQQSASYERPSKCLSTTVATPQRGTTVFEKIAVAQLNLVCSIHLSPITHARQSN